MNYELIIKPGVPVDVRHAIQNLLTDKGYVVLDGGTLFEESFNNRGIKLVQSDINFFKDDYVTRGKR